MTKIHPTALVDPGARIGTDVEIGPYCVVGPKVKLADGVRLHSHVVVSSQSTLGQGCEVFPFATIGLAPQDKKYKGEENSILIGDHTIIREHVTIHAGTIHGDCVTRVGSQCFILAGAHIAHDCQVGDHVTLVNCATLGGHVTIGDHATLGGLSAIHQFVRIGEYAFIGGMSGVEADVIPFGMVVGIREGLKGLNLVGLKRHGFSREQIQNLTNAYRMLFSGNGVAAERLEEVAKTYPDDPCVSRVVAFIRAGSNRPLLSPQRVKGRIR